MTEAYEGEEEEDKFLVGEEAKFDGGAVGALREAVGVPVAVEIVAAPELGLEAAPVAEEADAATVEG